ncbi:hypothetical protein JW926_11595 [Candidatus Sumerlaeota bacterium]|nr:hypothetical protein [Candidatus Sumerlaeota bacterium]
MREKGRSNKNPAQDAGEKPVQGKKPFGASLRFKVYVLIFFNLLLFSNTLFNRFTYDDVIYIVGNPHAQNPAKIFSLFTHAYPPHRPELSLYRPMVELTYLLDWSRSVRPNEFADLNFNDRVEMPFFHLNNIAFHIAVVLAIFLIVRVLLKNDRMAFVTALIFSAHPVHVETVTSIVGRAESMSAFFLLFSLYLFIREEKKGRLLTPVLIVSYLLFFFALLSKESAITLPLIIILTAWFLGMRRGISTESTSTEGEKAVPTEKERHDDHLGTIWKQAFLRSLPYGAIFILYLIIRLRIVGTTGIKPSGWYFRDISAGARLAAMCVGFLTYLRLLILPVSMSVDYNFPLRIAGPFWAEQPEGFLNIWALSGLTLVIIYVIFTIRAVKGKTPLSYPLLFFMISLFPFSNIMPFGDFIAERFLYLPSFGYCLFAGMLFIQLEKSPRCGKTVFILLIILLFFYSTRTFFRNRDWRTGIHLWKAEAKWNPRNPNLQTGLGTEYMAERKEQLILGNAYRKKVDFQKAAHHLELAREYEQKALEYFESALKKNPRDFMACYNYGCLAMEMKEPDLDRAEEILLQGASCMPDNVWSLHIFYYFLGQTHYKRNPPDLERAQMFLEKAHQLKKSNDTIQNLLAVVLGRRGHSGEALRLARQVLARKPENREAISIIRIIRREEENKIRHP